VKILLTGRDGQVGGELGRVLPGLGGACEVLATGRAELDLADHDALRRAVREAKPAVIINAAAYTAVDRAETEPALARRINAEAPGVLAEEAKRLGVLLVHYSTDYVFDGAKSAPWTEDDAPAPLNVYGETKLAGERAVLAAGGRCLILRASWVYAPRGRNFFLTIAAKARAGERLRVVDDQRGVPTSAAFIARATLQALRIATGAGLPRPLYHLAPTGDTTWCGFARAIAARVAPGAEVAAITSADYPQAAKRPANSVLDAAHARRDFGLPEASWESLLDECIAATQSDGNRLDRR
jgi:dTDP-4-dehydrorhamnose reductase